jgi:hypothetical protein
LIGIVTLLGLLSYLNYIFKILILLKYDVMFQTFIISNTYLSVASVNKEGIVQPPGKIYYSKKSRNVGFLYVDIIDNTGAFIWNYFTSPYVI